jgi:hypothetical protein
MSPLRAPGCAAWVDTASEPACRVAKIELLATSRPLDERHRHDDNAAFFVIMSALPRGESAPVMMRVRTLQRLQ